MRPRTLRPLPSLGRVQQHPGEGAQPGLGSLGCFGAGFREQQAEGSRLTAALQFPAVWRTQPLPARGDINR